MIISIIAIMLLVGSVVGFGDATITYAENTQHANSDIMGASTYFDGLWFIASLPAAIGTTILLHVFWAWGIALLIGYYLIGSLYKGLFLGPICSHINIKLKQHVPQERDVKH